MFLFLVEEREISTLLVLIERANLRIEVEISAIVGGFSIDFGDQCRLLPDDQSLL
jgi:hypothetical protein